MTQLSLAAVLAEPARRTPDKLAVVEGDVRMGYGDELIARYAKGS